jgi:hypothetical protein
METKKDRYGGALYMVSGWFLSLLFFVVPLVTHADIANGHSVCASGFGNAAFNGTYTYNNNGYSFSGPNSKTLSYQNFNDQAMFSDNTGNPYYRPSAGGDVLGLYLDNGGGAPGGTVTDGSCAAPSAPGSSFSLFSASQAAGFVGFIGTATSNFLGGLLPIIALVVGIPLLFVVMVFLGALFAGPVKSRKEYERDYFNKGE